MFFRQWASGIIAFLTARELRQGLGLTGALSAVRDHVVTDIAAENPDRGADRQRREFSQLLHGGIAFFATAHGVVLIRRIGRNIRIARRHHGRPPVLFESLAAEPAGERG